MRRWQRTRYGLKSLFLMALILASCSAPSDDGAGGGCGGSDASITCLTVTGIAPTGASGDTNNVDAQQNLCRDLAGLVTGVETFGDHNARITFSSQRFPTASITSRNFDIRIVGYSVTYKLNVCPAAARGCPPLTGFTVQESIVVPAGQAVTVTLPFVPLNTKNEYVRGGGELGIATPSYSATYTFTGQTIGVSDTFTFQGSSQFSIADFDNC